MPLTKWPASVDELVVQQQSLADMRPTLWRPPGRDLRVAGCFACAARGVSGHGARGDALWSAAVLIAADELVARALVRNAALHPYEAGLLALRQGPALAAAVDALPRADVVLVDATGRDHPRRAGLALHLGAVLEVPTIGVTHRPLVAEGPFPDRERGSVSPLRIDGEEVGAWLRTVRDARPLAVHAGWQTDVATAVAVVHASSVGARTPEPIREARCVARSARAAESAAPADLPR